VAELEEAEVTDEQRRTMERIHDEAVEALEVAKSNPYDIDGAINWGNLHVVDVEFYRSLGHEREGYRVLIEEADPYAPELHEFIATRLQDAGFLCVEVVTEW
jgi:nucleotide-binding universal stress UspA family protein